MTATVPEERIPQVNFFFQFISKAKRQTQNIIHTSIKKTIDAENKWTTSILADTADDPIVSLFLPLPTNHISERNPKD